jgi:hypothetical protein
MALLSFPPSPSNGDLYPVLPLPGQYQYRWSSADNTWRLEGVATGVIPGVYGSASQIPILTIDALGRTTTASFVDISTVYVKTNNPSAFNSYIWPNGDGAAGSVLHTDGSGNLAWSPAVSGTAPIVVTTGPSGSTVSITNATTAAVGAVQLATNAETQTGTNATKAVTPSSLQSKVSDSVATTSSTTIASSTAVKTAYDLAAAAIPKSTLLAKGDIVGATAAGTPVNVSVGTDGQYLKADSTAAAGVSWSTIQFIAFDDISGNFNGVLVSFPLTVGTVAKVPTPSTNIMVYLGGVAQIQGALNAYTVSGSTITFNSAPLPGTTFYAVTIG